MCAMTSSSPSHPVGKSTLSRYVSRMRDALRPTHAHLNPPAVSSPSPEPFRGIPPHLSWSHSTDTIVSAVSRAARAASPSKTSPARPSPQPEPEEAAEPLLVSDDGPSVMTLLTYATLDYERLCRIAEKWDIKIDTQPAAPVEPVKRVTKPIRVRAHRKCHKCGAAFGSAKVCDQCQHARCTRCPRQPTFLNDSSMSLDDLPRSITTYGPNGSVTISAGALVVDDAPDEEEVETLKRKYRYLLSLPPRTEGRELVRKKPMQRVRRICHVCHLIYAPGNRICAKCSHPRCAACPRDPAKRHKYPEGYPGDQPIDSSSRPCTANSSMSSFTGYAPPPLGSMIPGPHRLYKKPSRQIRYTCHHCTTLITNLENTCTACGHEKCPDCPRAPPRRKHASVDEGRPAARSSRTDRVDIGGVRERLRVLDMQSPADPALDLDSPADLVPDLEADDLMAG